MKVGTQAQFDETMILRHRSTLEFSHGCHGGGVCVHVQVGPCVHGAYEWARVFRPICVTLCTMYLQHFVVCVACDGVYHGV